MKLPRSARLAEFAMTYSLTGEQPILEPILIFALSANGSAPGQSHPAEIPENFAAGDSFESRDEIDVC